MITNDDIDIMRQMSEDKATDMLLKAIPDGKPGVVKMFLKHSKADPKANNSQALRNAAAWGHLEIVKLLLPHSDIEGSGASPLAVKYGHTDCADAIRSYVIQRDRNHLKQELCGITPGMEQRKARRM